MCVHIPFMVKKEIYEFWKKMFVILILSFFVFWVLGGTSINEYFIIIPFYLWIGLLVACRIGMTYHAYKMKRYGWMFCNLILGEIFWIIFLFSVLKNDIGKKEIKKKKKKKTPKLD